MDKNKKISAKIFPFYPNGQFYFERGVEAFREQRIKEAIRYLVRASELEPGNRLFFVNSRYVIQK